MNNATIKQTIITFVSDYKQRYQTQTSWLKPEVAFACADNQEFLSLKKVVSPTHALPTDILKKAKSVIVFFIPFTPSIPQSNRGRQYASEEWAIAYYETNKLIADLSLYIKEQLETNSYKTATIPATHNFKPEILMSDWSHRHVAYIAGLGTFGLNNMLITPKGCCGRIGSIITTLELEPTSKPKIEYCLYKQNKTCSFCIKRCVNEALSLDHFDRFKCYEMCLKNNDLLCESKKVDVCGKCLVDLPCSFVNPVKDRV